MHRFKEFEFWKKSRELNKEIYLVSAKFPNEEKFGLLKKLNKLNFQQKLTQ